MKSFNSSSKASADQANGAVQRVSQSAKTIVNNRPSAAIQRKLQEMVNLKGVLQVRSAKNGLPDELQAGIEALSGISMDDVKVHYNSNKPAKVGALAYAQGSNIYLAPGQEKQLAHEAWHVVQQKQGRVRPTLHLGGVAINNDKGLEREADMMGSKAAQTMHTNTIQFSIREQTAPSPRSGKTITDNRHAAIMQRKLQQVVDDRSNINDTHTKQEGTIQRVLQPGGPVPTLQSLIRNRFGTLFHKNVKTVDIELFKKEIKRSLSDYIKDYSGALVTERDCAKYGIRVALMMIKNIEDIGEFLTEATKQASLVTEELGLDAGQVFQTIDNRINLAYREALVQGINSEINKQRGLKEPGIGIQEIQSLMINVNCSVDINNLGKSVESILDQISLDYTKENPEENGDFSELNPTNKLILSRLLLDMPVVKAIIEKDGSFNDEEEDHKWSETIIAASQENPMKKEEIEVGLSVMKGRIDEALNKVNNLVDPNVLGHSEAPHFVIHKDLTILAAIRKKQYDNIPGFRPYAPDEVNEVHVGFNEKVETVMHEMGHQIENHLSTKEWLDIQKLLHMRQKNSPSSDTLSHVYDQGIARGVAILLPKQATSEPAYRGEMPATGRYSAKAYDNGATEVMSMSIEYFGNPDKARKLIMKDPLQAAIILRIIQPNQFQEYVNKKLPKNVNWLP